MVDVVNLAVVERETWSSGDSVSASVDTLVCVYTCERHRTYLEDFYRGSIGGTLELLPDKRIIEVYADPQADASNLDGNRLVLRTPEAYDALSLKTYEMIRFCVDHLSFRQLLKIDVTVVQTEFHGAAYEGRKPLDLEKLGELLANLPSDADYGGFVLRDRATRAGAMNWAQKKGGTIDYERLFGSGPMPPFYSGKCYFISRVFAEFVAMFGGPIALEHSRFFLGAEDVMIGRLNQQFGSG